MATLAKNWANYFPNILSHCLLAGIVDVEADEETDASSKVGVEVGDVAHVRVAKVVFHIQVELPVPAVKCHAVVTIIKCH